MRRILAAALLFAVFGGMSVMWAPERWSSTVSQVAVFAVGIGWIASNWGRFEPFYVSFAPISLLGMIAIGALQLAAGWTVSPWQTTESILYWSTNLCALVVAIGLSLDETIRRFLLRWLFIIGVAVSVFCLVHKYTSGGLMYWVFRAPYEDDLWGPFLYRNQYAAFIALLLPVAWWRALTSDHGRWPYLIVTAGLFSCVVASASRAGLVIVTGEVLFIELLSIVRFRLPMRRLAVATLPLLALTAPFVAVVGPETVWARIRKESAGGRGDFNEASLAMWRDRPATGFGLGTWPIVYPHYARMDDGVFVNQAHNDWAQAAVEGGTPAFLCLGALFLWAARIGWRYPFGFGLMFVLLHALVEYPIQRQALGVFYFVFAGVVAPLRGTSSSCNTSLRISRLRI